MPTRPTNAGASKRTPSQSPSRKAGASTLSARQGQIPLDEGSLKSSQACAKVQRVDPWITERMKARDALKFKPNRTEDEQDALDLLQDEIRRSVNVGFSATMPRAGASASPRNGQKKKEPAAQGGNNIDEYRAAWDRGMGNK